MRTMGSSLRVGLVCSVLAAAGACSSETTACDPGKFGPSCATCTCAHGTCDDAAAGSGECKGLCDPGWTGANCDECAAGHYGPSCLACGCGANAVCDGGIKGAGCGCATGFVGAACDQCAVDHWGASCQACACGAHGTCSEGLGGAGCACDPGWAGAQCDQCAADYWGASCQACACGAHGTCSEGLGGAGCACDPGWAGAQCNQCAAGHYGSSCVAVNYAFVTSTFSYGDLGGLSGADKICNDLASAAGLPGTFVAWLSTSTVDARDRVGGARGWIRADGRPFADSITQALHNPWYVLATDENGVVPPPSGDHYLTTWTGTDSAGVKTSATCSDWTTSSTGSGHVGTGDSGLYFWSSSGDSPCSKASNRLYCLGTDHANAISLVPAAGRFAFVSTGAFSPGGGLTAADDLCQSEATAAGLPGTYRAFLATDPQPGADHSASGRFVLTGLPWVRTDGVALGATAGAIGTRRLLAPIDVHADRSVTSNASVWTGSYDPSQAGDPLSPGPSSTCSDWTLSSGGKGKYGATLGSFSAWTSAWYQTCSSASLLYCLQE